MPEWMKQLLMSGAYFAPDDEGAGGGSGDGDESGNSDDAGDKNDEKDEGKNKSESDDSKAHKRILSDLKRHKDESRDAKKKLADAEAESTKLKARITELLGEKGLDGLADMLAKHEEEEEKKAADRGDFDAVKKRMRDQHAEAMKKVKDEAAEEIKGLKDKLGKQDAHLRQLLVSNQFATSSWVKENLTLPATYVERLFGDAFKVEERDGTLGVFAYKAGTPLVDANGEPLAFDIALRELVEADSGHKAFFKTKSVSGVGSRGSSNGDVAEKKDGDPGRGLGRIQASLNIKADQ